MIRQGSGVILAFGGSGPPPRDYYIGGTQVAFEAIESMRRQLASELGSHGIRVVTLRTGGVPESIPEDVNGRAATVEGIEKETMLGRAATLEDVGNAAAFAASDRVRTMTAATVNISCGALVDQGQFWGPGASRCQATPTLSSTTATPLPALVSGWEAGTRRPRLGSGGLDKMRRYERAAAIGRRPDGHPAR